LRLGGRSQVNHAADQVVEPPTTSSSTQSARSRPRRGKTSTSVFHQRKAVGHGGTWTRR
jgi:hypothetical protein